MANIPIYDGSPLFTPGTGVLTPFGFYDFDSDFQSDVLKVTKFCATRLGYPIENVELASGSFFTAFEQAITVYGNELYAYKQREDYLSLEGSDNSYSDSSTDLNNSVVTPNMGNVIKLSEQYGTEAGVGGDVSWYSGSVILSESIQDYDLDAWASSQGIASSDLEIKKVFYEPTPAAISYYGGAGLLGSGLNSFTNEAGLSGFAAQSFLMFPLSYNIQAIQQTEMYRDVLFSNYSFQLINNQLRIFPIPQAADAGSKLWFQYMLKSERVSNSIGSSEGNVNNIAQMPYRNPVYAEINSVGRSWIFEYTLALCKEMLGYVRGKYSQVPIPGAEVTLNQADLISAASNEKDTLVTKLREYFDSTSRQALLERRQAESLARNSELDQVPMTIYIG